MIHSSIQENSAHRYAKTFDKWTNFLRQMGRPDPYMMDSQSREVVVVITAYAAWARATGNWSGLTTMQSLAHIKHHWAVNARDTSMFSSPSIVKLRHSLKLTDRFDEARKNKKKRIPFTPDMVAVVARDAQKSADKTAIMVATGIVTASVALMRISEYGQAPRDKKTPDHRLYSRNITFQVEGQSQPLTPRQLKAYAGTSDVQVHRRIVLVNILIAGSKTDQIASGTMLTFYAKDFDLDDPTCAIVVWSRWACLVDHQDDEPFLAFRDEAGQLEELSAGLVTCELRRVAKQLLFTEDLLRRVSPHSIRLGMATHLHNLGVTSTIILQMGRWSQTSNAAQLYQRLGVGACSIVAKSVRTSVVASAHASADTLRSLARQYGYDDQYKKHEKARAPPDTAGKRVTTPKKGVTKRPVSGNKKKNISYRKWTASGTTKVVSSPLTRKHREERQQGNINT